MDQELFVVTVKGISIEGFEDIVVGVTVSYKGEEFSEQKAVKVPLFNSYGQKILETVAYEAYWKMKKHWGRLNQLPPPEEKVAVGDVESFKSFAGLEGTESTSE
jgi:hypothetical protein